jgi:hypothetical protein
VDVGDWTSFVFDWSMIPSSTSIVPVYLILDKPLGKEKAMALMIFSSTLSSFVVIYRIWKNMGATTNLLVMATLSTASSLGGVATNGIFLHEGNQLWHALMGFLFGGQQFGLAICFYLVVDPDDDKNHVNKGEEVLQHYWLRLRSYMKGSGFTTKYDDRNNVTGEETSLI